MENRPQMPVEVCRLIKPHAEAIREVLIGLYGDPDPDPQGRPGRAKWPAAVRDMAYQANCRLNIWILEDFGRLHRQLGLGPVMLGSECEHED